MRKVDDKAAASSELLGESGMQQRSTTASRKEQNDPSISSIKHTFPPGSVGNIIKSANLSTPVRITVDMGPALEKVFILEMV